MMPPARAAIAVLIGGFAGTVTRVQLADHWAHAPAAWPWATLTVNLAGALLLGVLAARIQHGTLPSGSHRERLLTAGFCGGLTTFSTLQLELVRMLDAGALGLAAAYTITSIVLGLAAVGIGGRIGHRGKWTTGAPR